MGNTTTAGKRHNSGDESLSSNTDFDFIPGQKQPRLFVQPSIDETEDWPIKGSLYHDPGFDPISRLRADSLSGPPRCNKLPTVFKWEGSGKDVFLSGSFNNWKSKIPLSKSQNEFCTIVELPVGTHQYKFYIDNQWITDPKEPVVDNKYGTKNNVISVKRSDFEVFEALKADSINTGEFDKEAAQGMSGSPPGEYCQEIPSRKTGEKAVNPPVLPPHLLQVILNKDVPISCEPTLLPEPNHVMLNHLYALSIKDGVMVLSATHRYRKKFVTTLLYKPITTS